MREAFLTGRLGREPELFSPQNSEYSVLKFSIANDDENRKDQYGAYQNVTSWFDVEFWTKKPQDWLQWLHKGDMVAAACVVKQDTWEDNGQKRSRVKFTIQRGAFPYVIPSQGGNGQPQQGGQPQQSQPQQQGFHPVSQQGQPQQGQPAQQGQQQGGIYNTNPFDNDMF